MGECHGTIDQQANLLASLDYFGFLMLVSLIGAVTMVARRVLR